MGAVFALLALLSAGAMDRKKPRARGEDEARTARSPSIPVPREPKEGTPEWPATHARTGIAAQRTIVVRCTDQTGAALAAVDVAVFGPKGEEIRARTDESGSVVVLLPLGDGWLIVASSPVGERAYSAVPLADGSSVTLVLARGSTIEGNAINASGTPLAGLTVTCMPQLEGTPTPPMRSALSHAVQTGSDGRFRFHGLAHDVDHEIVPQVPDALAVVARPPESLTLVLDLKWTVELRRMPTPLTFTWDIIALGDRPALWYLVPSRPRSNGSWPGGIDRLLIPVWPGKSRVRTQVAFATDSHETNIDLDANGEHAILLVPLKRGAPAVKVANPHSFPAAVFRYANDGDDVSARAMLAPGETCVLPAPRGRSRFLSAVYPGTVTAWDVNVGAAETVEVSIPEGVSDAGVTLTVADFQGRQIPRFQIVLNPAAADGWRVAYTDRVPALFTGSVSLSAREVLVIADDASRFEILASGYATRRGEWPRAGRLDVRMDRAP